MPLSLAESRPYKMTIQFLAPDHTPSANQGSRQPVAAGRSQTFTQPVPIRVTSAPYVLREPDVSSPESDRLSKSELRGSRAPRPTYSEEQKFTIMYLRIVRSCSWDEIADVFARTYAGGDSGQRSKGGLTSVYYRIRKSWGLKDVLDAQPGEALAEDLQAVEARAHNFSREFLLAIRYPLE